MTKRHLQLAPNKFLSSVDVASTLVTKYSDIHHYILNLEGYYTSRATDNLLQFLPQSTEMPFVGIFSSLLCNKKTELTLACECTLDSKKMIADVSRHGIPLTSWSEDQ